MHFPDIGTHTCRYQHSGGSTDVTMCNYVQVFSINTYTHTQCSMCHYPPVFLQNYLCILRRFLRRFLCRFLRGRIAIASPLHRHRIVLAPHRVAARNAGDVRTSLESNLPAVQPNRSTRTEEVEPQQWALGEAMIRTHVEVMVERMWLHDPAKIMSGAASSDEEKRFEALQWLHSLSTIHANNSNNQTMICSIMHNTSTINMN